MKHSSHVTKFCLQVWSQKNKRDPASAFGLESDMMKFKDLAVHVVPLTHMVGGLQSCQVITGGQVISQWVREITGQVHTSKIHLSRCSQG